MDKPNLFFLIFKLLWWLSALLLVVGVAISAWWFKDSETLHNVFLFCLNALIVWVGATSVCTAVNKCIPRRHKISHSL